MFTSKHIKTSALRIKKIDNDSCKHFEGTAIPYLYEAFACPSCGFAFIESFILSDRKKENIKSEYIDKLNFRGDYCSERTILEAIRVWNLALICAQVSTQNRTIQAWISLRIAWLYRYLNNSVESKFLTMSLAHYEYAYINEDIESSKKDILNMIFQLNISLNDETNAKHWLNELYKLKDMKLVREAKEQLDELRETNKSTA